HDFNNLLVSILGNATLLQGEHRRGSPTYAKLAAIVGAGEKAAELTSQMLAYSGKGSILVRPVNLAAQIRELSNLLGGSVPPDVRVVLELRDDVPPVDADPNQIEQLILNLVVNAGEAIGQHKGVVRIAAGKERVDGPDTAGFQPGDLPPGEY